MSTGFENTNNQFNIHFNEMKSPQEINITTETKDSNIVNMSEKHLKNKSESKEL
jgi:hypothetical protein